MRSTFRILSAMLVLVCLTTLQARAQHEQPPAPATNQGFLGGRFAPVEGDAAEELGLEEQDGVVAIEIITESPAEKAGLQVKDILKKIDDNDITDVDSFRAAMRGTKVGQTLKIVVLRGTETKEIPVTLGTRPPGFGATQPTTKPG